MAIGVQASGWGTYAVIADDPSSRALYIEFPRGSEAFTKIMDQSSGFGPKGFVFFRATGTSGATGSRQGGSVAATPTATSRSCMCATQRISTTEHALVY